MTWSIRKRRTIVKQEQNSPISNSKLFFSALALALVVFGVTSASFAQATHRVPRDFPTIQIAVNNANPGDTIRVGPGRWCGARITKTLNLVGEGTTVMGCPAGVPGPVGNLARRGFFINVAASGTSIRDFTFDGTGFSDTNRNPLALGIDAGFGTNDVVVDNNLFLGGLGILSEDFQTGPFTGNAYLYNVFIAKVPPGSFSFASFTNEVDVPFVGIGIAGHNGTIIANNKMAITSNATGDAGVGIIATDASPDGISSTCSNLVITNNEGRLSQYGLIITRDQSLGTGNTVGATIRGNFGVNLIDGLTSFV